MDTIVKAFEFAGVTMDGEEAECVVSNLIAQGLIKGYISHEKQMVVLSKETPFPKIKDVILKAGVF